MICCTAFAPLQTPFKLVETHDSTGVCPRQCVPVCVARRTTAEQHVPSAPQTRRAFITSLTALAMLPLAMPGQLQQAAATESVSPVVILQQARRKVDDIDGLIDLAKWDSVRTVLAGPTVNSTKDACKQLIETSSSDLRSAIVGLKEDLLSAMRLLDTSVYSNVFIGEDRQILGTKVDYDTPRTYLLDLKNALDELIEISTS